MLIEFKLSIYFASQILCTEKQGNATNNYLGNHWHSNLDDF
jgi:hypothetical protein